MTTNHKPEDHRLNEAETEHPSPMRAMMEKIMKGDKERPQSIALRKLLEQSTKELEHDPILKMEVEEILAKHLEAHPEMLERPPTAKELKELIPQVKEKLEQASAARAGAADCGTAADSAKRGGIGAIAITAVAGLAIGFSTFHSPRADASGSAAAFAALFEVIMTAIMDMYMTQAQNEIGSDIDKASNDQIKAIGTSTDAQIDHERGIYDHQRTENARPPPTQCVTTATGAASAAATSTRRNRAKSTAKSSAKQVGRGVENSAAFVVGEMSSRESRFPESEDIDAVNFAGKTGYATEAEETAAEAFIRRATTETKANLVKLPEAIKDKTRALGYKSKHLQVGARALAAEHALLSTFLRRKKNLSTDQAVKQGLDRQAQIASMPEESAALSDARKIHDRLRSPLGMSEMEVVDFDIRRRLESPGYRALMQTYTEPTPLLRELVEMTAQNNYLLFNQLEMQENTLLLLALQVLDQTGKEALDLAKDYGNAVAKPSAS